MAALSDIDLVRILGEDARAQLDAASVEKSDNPELIRRKTLQAIEGKQFTAFALILMGVVLFVSAYYTAAETTLIVQCAVAAVSLLGGIGWNLVLSAQKKRL